ncbi:helix-turn-helix domain-containing protein [Salisediminibacterium selenitireducens]|uniref:Helicase Helix-turn-helix domain-containing protein n=1 Tax=Bacillus selenitireducens (strain ATCC 700615 / DSM 15326 / MLS10) TaxID=439292 RepID=D6XVD1_BACIE|nr:helix-turn-helix domain-containing protein [Salisediminibacterium selenitireducens]ADH99669.1 conserved hypothetical protein [[Bacillus] selenitireducens MLS10]
MDFDHRAAVFLHRKINGQRTLSALMQILLGNRTAQTISDLHLFHLEQFAGILKYAPGEIRNSFEKTLRATFHEDLQKTADGLSETAHPLSEEFDGMNYEWTGRAAHLWESLSLFIQTLSHLKQGDRFFFPVSSDMRIQQQVKSVLKNRSLNELIEAMYQELLFPLQDLNEPVQALFVDRLTVKNEVGLSYAQLSSNYQMSPFEAYIMVRSALHALLAAHDFNPAAYPILNMLMPKTAFEDDEALTESAKQTRQLLNKGLSLQEVSKTRKLKISTVEDHIVELAHVDYDFDYGPYLEETELKEILKHIREYNLTRLRLLKEATGGKYTYLQLRIAMAMARRRKQ